MNPRPSFEICIKGDQRNYSLLLAADSPKTLLIDTLKYFNIPKEKEIQKALDKMIAAFLPKRPFEGPGSSPMPTD